MEISLKKEEITETSQFVNFSIREYVAGIRKKDWRKCWPFGSLGDPNNDEFFYSYQSKESTFSCSQNCPSDINGSDDSPEHKEAPNSSNVETCIGKEDRSETTSDMIESLGINDDMGKSICNGYPELNSSKANKSQNGPEISTDSDEQGRNRPQRKRQRFRLLSDILRNLDNVNTTEGVEVIPMLKNKRMKIGVDQEPRFEKEEKSNHGSKDSDVGPLPCFEKVNQFTEVCNTEPKETPKEDSEMEAVMLLATHFNEENPSRPDQDCAKKAVESGLDQGFAMEMGCACVKKKIRSSSNKESVLPFYISAIKDPTIYAETEKFMKMAEYMSSMGGAFQNRMTYMCSINRNPADFSIPNAENVFMRGG